MEIGEETRGRVTIVSARGRLDSMTSPAFGDRLQQLAAKAEPCLLIDLSGVDFISSAGLRAITAALKSVNARHGTLAVCTDQDHVREVFDLTGFAAMVRVFPERGLALKHLNVV